MTFFEATHLIRLDVETCSQLVLSRNRCCGSFAASFATGQKRTLLICKNIRELALNALQANSPRQTILW
jgi:hypothetical protein